MGLVYAENFTLTVAFLALGYIFSLYPTFFAIQTLVYNGPNLLNSIKRITRLLLLKDIEEYVEKQEIGTILQLITSCLLRSRQSCCCC
jgi:hypothetical protein